MKYQGIDAKIIVIGEYDAEGHLTLYDEKNPPHKNKQKKFSYYSEVVKSISSEDRKRYLVRVNSTGSIPVLLGFGEVQRTSAASWIEPRLLRPEF